MKSPRILSLLLLFAVVCWVMVACKPELVSRPDAGFAAVNAWLAENRGGVTYGLPGQEPDMEQAFRQGYVLIYAEGLPKAGVEHAGQKRLTAQRAAELVAQRRLADVLSRGGRYGSVRFDTYSAPLKPTLLQGGHVVVKDYSGELVRAAVLLKYDLRGARKFQD